MSRYFVSIRRLCACCYPVKITRGDGWTLQEIDPRAPKAEMLAVAYRQLRTAEIEAGRRAYGQPPIGQPMSQSLLEGQVLPYVPPSLRVPGEPPIQNPDLTCDEGREAFQAALEWLELETVLVPAERVS